MRGEKFFFGVSYTGSTLALGASRPSSILGTPKKNFSGCAVHIRGPKGGRLASSHTSFSAENARDPASRRRAAALVPCESRHKPSSPNKKRSALRLRERYCASRAGMSI